MDLVLVQQENIAGAPAGVRVGARLVIGIAPFAHPHLNTQGASELGWGGYH